MKKILILYGSYGSGHLSAAKNIKEYIENNYENSEVVMVDCIEYINKFLNKITTKAYSVFSKHAPNIWAKIYYGSEKGFLAGFSNFVNRLMAKKLNKLINNCKPDIIISTHPFSSQMCSILKKKNTLNIPVATIMTDYAPHNQWLVNHEFIDYYFVAHDNMKSDLMQKGISENKIFATGIPVSSRFLLNYNKEEIVKQYNLQLDKKIILFFVSGTYNLGKEKMTDILKSIISDFSDLQFIMITGKNEKIKNSFDEMVKQTSSENLIKVLLYTNQVPELMAISDLVITKPGGLTTTESLCSELPIVAINPIPGQEEENAKFIEDNNVGIWVKRDENFINKLHKILNSENSLQNMKSNAKQLAKKESTKSICETLLV